MLKCAKINVIKARITQRPQDMSQIISGHAATRTTVVVMRHYNNCSGHELTG